MSMKKLFLLVLVLGTCCMSALADYPKREMRATWFTTVANIDWPSSPTSSASTQKNEMTRMLDSIASMNMNTVLFHIRPACDALYRSHYEPWSSYVSRTRGTDPGYDPLEFCIDECHKRGLSCHGWINPYRYNDRSSGGDWKGNNDTTHLNYKYTHPEWLLWYKESKSGGKGDIVLNPGLPEVIQHIKCIIGDIINNYDIDGILMDDYFYPYGGTSSQDSETVNEYCPADMAVGDWRRQNVNRMVQACYDTIQAVKPWLTFGVSPFGIWTTNYTVAKNRGYSLANGVTGGNMYEEIYCDPVAWLEEGTVDYISPQLYWRIGGSQDYKTLSRWWADMTGRFGKHFYSSMAIYRYPSAEGFDVEGLEAQAQQNRDAVKDNAPGAVFYNTKAWVYEKPIRNAFKSNEFKYPALQPAINWKPAKERQMVENLRADGQTISWDYPEKDVRFAIYAVPNAYRNRTGVFSKGEVLVGISYTTSFTLPKNITTGACKIAVSVLDGYNNEYSLRVLGESVVEGESTNLMEPRDGDARKLPFTFTWSSVTKADSYIFQIARDEEMQDIIMAQETTETSLATSLRRPLSSLENGTYYWRVKTRKANANDVWSAPRRLVIATADGLEETKMEKVDAVKTIDNGLVYIQKDNQYYTLQGQIK